MPTYSKFLRKKLKNFGLSNLSIAAAWPDWWDKEAENSSSACTELQFSLARKLGLDPRSLLDEEEPRFIWNDEAKFKHFSGKSDFERAALTSFAVPIARALIHASPPTDILQRLSPKEIRETILRSNPHVGLKELISLCWVLGIPVINLKVFPLSAKRMRAMTVNNEGRFVIIIGRESSYPAEVAYYLSHELGHIMLDHLKNNLAIVEFDGILKSPHDGEDSEELEADRFALEVLTGSPEPIVLSKVENFLAKDLARKALEASNSLQIEPGTLALCLGHSTGNWRKVFASMKFIYSLNEPLWKTINSIANSQMDLSLLSDEFSSYMNMILGSVKND